MSDTFNRNFHRISMIHRGFTLIELLVVIAIIGVLAAVLITAIDPTDKINLANDTGVISTIAQLGKANDAYGANHSNNYVGGTFAQSVTALNTNGEIKYTALTAPSGYTYNYYTLPAGCATGACTTYVYSVNVKSKKYTTTPYYIYAMGKGCFTATVPSATSTCP